MIPIRVLHVNVPITGYYLISWAIDVAPGFRVERLMPALSLS